MRLHLLSDLAKAAIELLGSAVRVEEAMPFIFGPPAPEDKPWKPGTVCGAYWQRADRLPDELR